MRQFLITTKILIHRPMQLMKVPHFRRKLNKAFHCSNQEISEYLSLNDSSIVRLNFYYLMRFRFKNYLDYLMKKIIVKLVHQKTVTMEAKFLNDKLREQQRHYFNRK